MIYVNLNKQQFEYDIHSLVKAFYPAEDVKVVVGETEDVNFRLLFLSDGIQFEQMETGRVWSRTAKTEIENQADKDELKNQVKLLIYKALSEVTEKQLPWGTLTGIRPTKIATAMLEQGRTEDEIRAFMREKYLVSPEKQELSIEIAHREEKLLSSLHGVKGYSVYIGIPFCPTTCLYCSFTSYPIAAWRDRVGEYLDALDKEIDFVAENNANDILDTVYIGGGTPSTLNAEQLERLLHKIVTTLPMEQVSEFTVEAGRADSITRDKLEVLKKYGVTRISVNPQTMNQITLDRIGRRHTVEQVLEAFQLARELEFDNINMDMILGLPGEGVEEVKHTMEVIKELKPDSLTVHSLAIKRASKLAQWIRDNGMEELHNTDETMAIAEKTAREIGLVPYYLYRQKNMSGNFENVGYAAPGKFGVYNVLIMEEKQTIVALGAGSITKRVYPNGRIERCENVKDIEQYLSRIDEMIERKRELFREE